MYIYVCMRCRNYYSSIYNSPPVNGGCLKQWHLCRLECHEVSCHCVIRQLTVYVCGTGYGGLSLSIEGPSKADIDCKDRPDGTCQVSYKPTQAGTYVISIKFADEHVPGALPRLFLIKACVCSSNIHLVLRCVCSCWCTKKTFLTCY